MTMRTACVGCGASTLAEIIDLGLHPMADTFVPPERVSDGIRVYPLVCDLCAACGLVQLRTVTRPEERYIETDYSYTSSNSASSRAHWAEYARHVSRAAALPEGGVVCEAGSNDGFALAEFASLGYTTIGVDPSPVMSGLAAGRGVQTITGFFSPGIVDDVLARAGARPHLIVANNVFNHANEPGQFVAAVRELLAPGGTFVFELPYWLRSIEQGKIDQVYHEHVTYPTVTSVVRLLRSHGLDLVDAEEVDYHGGSLRGYVCRAGEREPGPTVARLAAEEREAGLFTTELYRRVMAATTLRRDRFLERVYALRASGGRIVCIGAAAKGNTFLNYYNLDGAVVDFVTDASPSKQGKLTPNTNIPIVPDSALAGAGAVYAIVLSWNIMKPLVEKLLAINPDIQFLNPYEGPS